jgi:hypothetical protein
MQQEPGGTWAAHTVGTLEVRASGSTREACLGNLRRSLARTLRAGSRRQPLTLVVEVIPELAGVAEAAEVMGWDKRRVITYIDRGRFPVPIQALASGRVWIRSDVEEYAATWRARRRRRK